MTHGQRKLARQIVKQMKDTGAYPDYQNIYGAMDVALKNLLAELRVLKASQDEKRARDKAAGISTADPTNDDHATQKD